MEFEYTFLFYVKKDLTQASLSAILMKLCAWSSLPFRADTMSLIQASRVTSWKMVKKFSYKFK